MAGGAHQRQAPARDKRNVTSCCPCSTRYATCSGRQKGRRARPRCDLRCHQEIVADWIRSTNLQLGVRRTKDRDICRGQPAAIHLAAPQRVEPT